MRRIRAALCWLIGHHRMLAYDEKADSALVIYCGRCQTVIEGPVDG